MAYDGFLAFAGTEIANRARLNAYMSAYLPGVLRECECECSGLADVLGDGGYSTPFSDDAPWVDPDDPDTGEFLGVLINSMSGIDDSTRKVTYVQSINAGGAVTGTRDASREVRFKMTMFARTDAGMEAGWRWLKAALKGSCGYRCVPGDDLCFFSSCPPYGRVRGTDVTRTVLPQTLSATNGVWDGSVFVPRDVPPEPADEDGYHSPEPGATRDSLGYWTGVIESDMTGYHITTAPERALDSFTGVLRTERFDRPLPCGPVTWSFDLTGDGTVMVEARSTDGLLSSVEATLTPEVSTWTVTDNGVPDENTNVWAQVRAGFGTDVRVHAVRVTYEAAPEAGDECADDYYRVLRLASVIDGPRLRVERDLPYGGVVREIDFTLAAMTPAVFGLPRQVASSYRGQTVARQGARIGPWSGVLTACDPSPLPPLVDPDCPQLAPLPSVPTIDMICGGVDATAWKAAYLAEIPGTMLRQWTDMVPIVALQTDQPTRGVRVRFFPRIDESWTLSDLDPCSACGTFEVSYIPANTKLTLDGGTQRVVAEDPGGRLRAASHLVSSGTNDLAFAWPELACGIGYYMLVEVADTELAGVSLALATKE